MDGLDALIRSVIATAKAIVGGQGGVMVTVIHRAALKKDGYGKVTQWGDPVPLEAIEEASSRVIREPGGKERQARHKLSFLANVTFTMDDELTLPDGTKGPIVAIGGLEGSGGPYFAQVWLG
jgi:hypothetical protein